MVVFLGFFRYQTFPDVNYYSAYYDFLSTQSIVRFYEYWGTTTEPGYVLFNKLLTYISSDSRFLYIVRGVLFSYCIVYVIGKYSTNYFLSIVLFFLCFGVNQSIYVVRQYLALSIFLLSINSIKNGKLLKYLFVWAVAFSIHSSMIIFLPLYFIFNYIFISKIGIKKIVLIGFLIALGLKSLFFWVASELGFYDAYLLSDTEEGVATIGMAIRSLVLYIPFLIYCSKYVFSDGYARLFFWVGLLNVIVAISIVGIPSGSRLFTNYNAFCILMFPYIMNCIKIRGNKNFYIISIILIYMLLYFIKLPVYNYYFIWQDCNEYYS